MMLFAPMEELIVVASSPQETRRRVFLRSWAIFNQSLWTVAFRRLFYTFYSSSFLEENAVHIKLSLLIVSLVFLWLTGWKWRQVSCHCKVPRLIKRTRILTFIAMLCLSLLYTLVKSPLYLGKVSFLLRERTKSTVCRTLSYWKGVDQVRNQGILQQLNWVRFYFPELLSRGNIV